MSASTFFIGDTHFGHKKLAAVRGFVTVGEHDEGLIERWNAVVRKRDTVWHLADVLFGVRCFPLLARLNGNKKLVAGNHDQYPTARYAEHFSRICGATEVDGMLLTHIPVNENQLHRWPANIHGHTHHRRVTYPILAGYHASPNPAYWCVSAEQNDLTPISLEALKEKCK